MAQHHARHKGIQTHRIEIKLRDINQLFNTMDPSPFYEKDLDADAEEFIVSWAQEIPLHEPVVLTIHLSQPQSSQLTDAMVEEAVQHYFSYRENLSRLEFGRMMADGRVSLLIGLAFLSVCLFAAGLVKNQRWSTAGEVVQESLTIAGWVAMWRPLQLYLYDWWPLRRRWKVYGKMRGMRVEIVRE